MTVRTTLVEVSASVWNSSTATLDFDAPGLEFRMQGIDVGDLGVCGPNRIRHAVRLSGRKPFPARPSGCRSAVSGRALSKRNMVEGGTQDYHLLEV